MATLKRARLESKKIILFEIDKNRHMTENIESQTSVTKKIRAKVNYANGKIYRLWANESDCFYIGSTTTTLRQRLSYHKLAKFEGYTNVKIELIEYYPCRNRVELNAREGHWVRKYEGFLINRNIPGRTDRQRYLDQREEKLHYAAAYYNANKKRILEQNRQRRRGTFKTKRVKLTDEEKREKNKLCKALYYQKHKNVLSEKTRLKKIVVEKQI